MNHWQLYNSYYDRSQTSMQNYYLLLLFFPIFLQVAYFPVVSLICDIVFSSLGPLWKTRGIYENITHPYLSFSTPLKTKKYWCCTYWKLPEHVRGIKRLKRIRILKTKMVAVNLPKKYLRKKGQQLYFGLTSVFCITTFLENQKEKKVLKNYEPILFRYLFCYSIPKEFYSPTTTTTLFVSVKKRI